jgi:hypothetical protein
MTALATLLSLALVVGCDGGSGDMKEGIPEGVVPGQTPAPVAPTGLGMMGPGAAKKQAAANKAAAAATPAPAGTPSP